MQIIKRFLSSEDGVTSIEYAMIALLIATVCIPAFVSLGDNSIVSMSHTAAKFEEF